jgi:hypothetical protein
MTLITHFRNSQIAVIAGDSRNFSYYNCDDNARKVFDFKDCTLGYYGEGTSFRGWLEIELKEDDKRLEIGFEQIIDKVKKADDNPRFLELS